MLAVVATTAGIALPFFFYERINIATFENLRSQTRFVVILPNVVKIKS
jgi:hypothetical protein